MADFDLKHNVVCPACGNNRFEISQSGFIVKKYVLQCKGCSLKMETSISQTDFRILSVGPNYQNAAKLLVDRKFTLDELGNSGLIVVSDTGLTELSAGEGEFIEALLDHGMDVGIIPKKNEKFIFGIRGVSLKEERSLACLYPSERSKLQDRQRFALSRGIYRPVTVFF